MNLTFVGDTGLSVRQQQASALNGFLQNTLDDGSPGLGPSLQATSYPGVIHAQTRINTLVGSWGALSSVGGLNLTYVGSDAGLTVAPDQTTTITCSVNSQLLDTATIQLSASVVASKAGDWSTAVSVQTLDNKPLFSLDIKPQQSIAFLVKVTGVHGLTDFGDPVQVEVLATLPTHDGPGHAPRNRPPTPGDEGRQQNPYTLSVGRFPSGLPATHQGAARTEGLVYFQEHVLGDPGAEHGQLHTDGDLYLPGEQRAPIGRLRSPVNRRPRWGRRASSLTASRSSLLRAPRTS